MSERLTVPLAECIRTAVRKVASSASDAELLLAFVQSRDPAAFEQIVRRHGPLVHSACRHILADPADADDACQATFVVLYRKAHTVRNGRLLGGWLFHVARRAAVEVKRSATRRRFHEERSAREELISGPDLSWREACALLHEELDRLPAKYRLPLIACYLEGRTQDEAARDLGWPADVVRGRIDRGRSRLGRRLRLRGVTLSAGLLAAATVTPAAPAIGLPAVLGPSPAAAAAAGALTAAGRAWTIAAGIVVAAGLTVGAAMLQAGRADPSAPPPAPPAKEPAAAKSAPKLDAFGDPLPDGAIARLGTVRFNHGDGMRSLVYSPDGKMIVSVGNGRARVWDADTGAELRQFSTGTSDWNEEAVLTPDGKNLVLLIQSFRDDPLRVFDVETGKSLRDTKLPVRRNELSIERKNALSPDGKLAALFGPDRIQVHDVETTKQLYAMPKKGREVKSIAFAGPELLVTADQAKKIEVWEARTGKLVHSFDHGGPVGAIGAIAASGDGKLLATVDHTTEHVEKFLEKDVVRVWDLATGKQKHEFASRPNRYFMRIGFSPDGKLVQAYSAGQNAQEVHVWNAETGKQVGETHDAVGQVMAMSPDGKQVVAGSEHGGKFEAWDAASGKPVVAAEAPGPWAGTVHLSPTGDRVLTLNANALVTWDGTTGRAIKTTLLDPHLAERPWCQFSPDGRYAVLVQANEKDGRIVIWDVTAGKAMQTIPVSEPPYGVAAAFSQDSGLVAIRLLGKDPKVTIRDLKTGKESVAVQLKSENSPDQMFFTQDGQMLVVSGKRTVGYSLPSGKEEFAWVMSPEPSKSDLQMGIGGAGGVMRESDRRAWRSLVVSPDGTLAACVLDAGWGPKATMRDRIALCDARTGNIIRRWGDSGKQSRGYEVMAFSPDGRLLATSEGNDIHLWEAATGKEVRSYRGHRNEVHAMAFSANGRRLASSGTDATTVIWELSAATQGNADPAALWAELLNDDAAKAYPAVWRLADAADDVVIPFVKKQIRPVTAEDMAKIRRAIRDLDSDEFRIRDRAFKDLADLGYAAQVPLRAALDKQPSAESRHRVEQLLAKVVGPPAAGESLRTARALSVLEAKGNPAAKEFLRELAGGVADAWLTQEAKAALRRVEGR